MRRVFLGTRAQIPGRHGIPVSAPLGLLETYLRADLPGAELPIPDQPDIRKMDSLLRRETENARAQCVSRALSTPSRTTLPIDFL